MSQQISNRITHGKHIDALREMKKQTMSNLCKYLSNEIHINIFSWPCEKRRERLNITEQLHETLGSDTENIEKSHPIKTYWTDRI